MHGHSQRAHISVAALPIWTLDPCDLISKWKAGKASFRILDLWCHPIYKRELLLPRIPSCSVVSLVQDDIIYIIVDDMLNTEVRGPCMLSLDMNKHRVLSAFMPPPETRGYPPPSYCFKSYFLDEVLNHTYYANINFLNLNRVSATVVYCFYFNNDVRHLSSLILSFLNLPIRTQTLLYPESIHTYFCGEFLQPLGCHVS